MDDISDTIVKTDGRSKEAREAKRAAAEAAKREAQAIETIESRAERGAPIRRASPRTNPRSQQTHEPTHEPRTRPGRVAVTGRDGETLTRRREQTSDPFAIPAELIEKGWEMQWMAMSVKGDTEVVADHCLGFQENGWRPVPSARWPGRFMPVGHKGSIVRGSQMLMERPKELCDEARREDKGAAVQLLRDRDESLLGGKASLRNAMGNGFEMSRKYRGTGGDVRLSIDPGLNIPAPGGYELEK